MLRLFVLTLFTAFLFSIVGGGKVMGQQFTISGTVTGPGAVPQANVDVFLYDDQGNPVGGANTITDGSGFYSIPGIPAGTYGLLFDPPKISGLLSKFVAPVVVTGNTTANVTLLQGNFLSGFVRDSLGAAIFNIDINVYDFVEDTVLTTSGDNTDITGFYQVLIPDGTFRLLWRPVSGENLVPVEIPAITITNDTSIDITMLAGANVSGMVRQPNLTPVFNADLDFINSTTGQLVSTPSDNTAADGSYLVKVPHGTYDIRVTPLFADGLAPIEIPNVAINGNTVMNFIVSPGHIISGTVTGPARAPVAGADIDLFNTSTGAKLFTPSDNTNSLGQYQILAVTGMYDVVAKPPVATHLAPMMTDSINVSTATVVNFSVPSGFLITGTVRNSNLAPVSGVDIDAAVSSTGAKVFLAGDNTDASGNFGVVIVGGTYHLDIEPPVTRRLTAEQLKNLSVTSDMALNFTLDTGIIITGTARDSAGSPVSNVDVSAIVNFSGDTVFTPLDNTGLTGTYQVLVPPDVYNLIYTPEPPTILNDTVTINSVSIVHDTTINVQFSAGLPACCVGTRGDANNDGTDANILDLTFLVNRIFRGGPPAVCPQEADLDSNGTPSNILDLTFLVNRIFRGGPPAGPC